MTPVETLTALAAEMPDCGLTFEVSEKYHGDWLMRAGPDDVPLALARPKTSEQVSHLLAACNAARIPVVPQGGLTGLTGGAVPSKGALLVSMERMIDVEPVDVAAQTVVVGAGVPLERIQEIADAAGLMFPLDIGSRGTCQIGGNLSTNAGGNRVLRYGMARALVLGLEVVLADGTIISSLNQMLKNNAGFDLKQMFIGSEGTLGIITRVVLRLVPKPRAMAVSLASFADYPQCERYLALARTQLGDALSAFEVMWPDFYERATARKAGAPPLPVGAGAYALVEISTSDDSAEAQLGAFLEAALEAGIVEDAVLAQSVQQTRTIWAIRDMGGELIQAYSPAGNFDLSVATSRIDSLVTQCCAVLEARWPGIETIFFGHVCDGNIHLIAGGFGADQLEAVELAVYQVTRDHQGSISAEHGIGLHKRDHLGLSRTEAEIALMRTIKAALDPHNILNPGKVLA
ncbi:MAG: FAD-binding oxidoreductase [Sphingomonadaceae bacterium]